MKQGTGKNVASGQKVQPKSHAVNVTAVSEIGIHQSRFKSVKLFEGRGIEAPKPSSTNHPKGSQGKR